MRELAFIENMVEEQLVKGNLRWLANFNQIYREYALSDLVFPVYATGTLQERGFFLSRIYSTLVTPKYGVNFFLYTAQEVDPKFLRHIILAFKSRFTADDWVFLAVVQSEPFGNSLKAAVREITDKTIGIAAYSLASKETVTSNNVLGKGLSKQLKLTEAQFEAFDLVNYVKSFTIVFAMGTLLLVVVALSGLRDALQPLTVLFMALFSLIAGHVLYKTRYHTTLLLTSRGFQLKEGNAIKQGSWSDYEDVSIRVAPNRETFLRLAGKDKTLDLSLSRSGLSRRESYDIIKQLIRKRPIN